MRRQLIFYFLFFVLVSCHKKQTFQELYDQKTKQNPIFSQAEIDKVLATFPTLAYAQLDKKYVVATGLNQSIYYHRFFYVIQGDDIYKYLVGKFRVLDFLPKDEFYKKNLENLEANQKLYLLLDKRVLYKFLELMHALEQKGYNKNAFEINDGYRYPVYNKKVGGSMGSLHTQGMAIDIEIGDIDKNNKIEKKDKKIVLDLLENQIIGKFGGVGRYPWSQTVHFDVRGWYARWDRQ